ncbi:hypothetical protein EYR40_008467 [Pleurotus pulmonarius]|nr:hypothetical protein EYR36_009285 [Pleurotus pulmonarius]KAF4592784.1 hypothetical protein EYR38_008485 [Pleurotus pulmonarius]KAF4593678.1 hypothetical protein EYR40_008467 [Pleurotus pulmonarius]
MDGRRMNPLAIQAKFAQISPMMLKQYKSELGIPDNNQPLSDQDKMELGSIHRLKRPGQPGMNATVDSSLIIRQPMTDTLDQPHQPGGGGPNHHPDERMGTPSKNPPMNIMHPNSMGSLMGGLQYRTNNVGSVKAGSPPPRSKLDNDLIAPPPSSMLSIDGGGPEIIFSSDFITSVANALGDFDASSIFRPDGDINFDRDSEQRFYNGPVALSDRDCFP